MRDTNTIGIQQHSTSFQLISMQYQKDAHWTASPANMKTGHVLYVINYNCWSTYCIYTCPCLPAFLVDTGRSCLSRQRHLVSGGSSPHGTHSTHAVGRGWHTHTLCQSWASTHPSGRRMCTGHQYTRYTPVNNICMVVSLSVSAEWIAI